MVFWEEFQKRVKFRFDFENLVLLFFWKTRSDKNKFLSTLFLSLDVLYEWKGNCVEKLNFKAFFNGNLNMFYGNLSDTQKL